MFYHDSKLQYRVRGEEPNLGPARPGSGAQKEQIGKGGSGIIDKAKNLVS